MVLLLFPLYLFLMMEYLVFQLWYMQEKLKTEPEEKIEKTRNGIYQRRNE